MRFPEIDTSHQCTLTGSCTNAFNWKTCYKVQTTTTTMTMMMLTMMNYSTVVQEETENTSFSATINTRRRCWVCTILAPSANDLSK